MTVEKSNVVREIINSGKTDPDVWNTLCEDAVHITDAMDVQPVVHNITDSMYQPKTHPLLDMYLFR